MLELGGKDPMLVLQGADLKSTGAFAARNTFGNSGRAKRTATTLTIDFNADDEGLGQTVNRTREDMEMAFASLGTCTNASV